MRPPSIVRAHARSTHPGGPSCHAPWRTTSTGCNRRGSAGLSRRRATHLPKKLPRTKCGVRLAASVEAMFLATEAYVTATCPCITIQKCAHQHLHAQVEATCACNMVLCSRCSYYYRPAVPQISYRTLECQHTCLFERTHMNTNVQASAHADVCTYRGSLMKKNNMIQ